MTSIVIATRSGVVTAPDGKKHRLVRGRTLADARHPVAEQFPELFAPHVIELPYEGDEPAVDGDRGSLEYFTQQADEYREQLAAVVEVLRAHDALPSEEAMNEPGWLAAAVEAALAADDDPVEPPVAPRRGPGRPRKQQP